MDVDVVVVGAGAAGLAAALNLAGRSARVVLLEARDRVGGRVWSREVLDSSTSAELGAEFIHGPAHKTIELLREAGSAALPVGGESWLASAGGLERADQDFRSAAHIFEKARSLAQDESVDAFLRHFNADPKRREAARLARAFVEGFDAADPATASAKAIAEEWRSGVDSAIARPRGSYAPMFRFLQRTCTAAGVEMRLSASVRRIAWRRGDVAVQTRDVLGQTHAVHARAAVITLPVGVLRHEGDETAVMFEPALPHAKREALTNIAMGHAVRVTLWFRTAFWDRLHNGRYRDGALFRGEEQPYATYWTQLPVRNTLFVAWAGGPKALALSPLSESQRIERALEGLGQLFREPKVVREEFVDAATHDWWRDPLARGAYSYLRVGGGHARAALAAPVDDTLFFAGEATSTDGQGGTVNGALETGDRAALEAASVLDLKVQ